MEELSVALLTPASEPLFGNPNVFIDLLFARAGNDVIAAYDPFSNDRTTVDIDFLFGDIFDNTPEEFEVILQIQAGNGFAILDTDIPSIGADRFVLGDEFQSYYTNFNPFSLLSNDFLGFNQFAFIYDFAPEEDTIQLNSKKDDYALLKIDSLPASAFLGEGEAAEGATDFSGYGLFSLQTGVPDLVSLILQDPSVELDLGEDYFSFVGDKPEDKPEEKKIGQLSTTGTDNGTGIAVDVDANGNLRNLYVTGGTNGSLFGNNKGFGDIFLARYDASGDQVFGKQLGTAASESASAVVVDTEGNVYLAGSTGGDLFGKVDPNASSEAWVAKYKSDGSLDWGKQFSLKGAFSFPLQGDLSDPSADPVDAFSTSGFGLQVDKAGNVYLSGLGIKDNQNRNLFNFEVEDDSWLTKFNSEGEQQWTTVLDTFVFTESYDLAVYDDGGDNNFSYFVGWTQGLLDFAVFGGPGNPALPQRQSDPSRELLKYDAWLTKVNNNDGSIEWIRQYGSENQGLDFGWGVDTDSQGNIYTLGWTTGNIETANGTSDGTVVPLDYPELSEERDLFIAKFNPNGTKEWVKQISSEGLDGTYTGKVTVDDQDNIYFTGFTNGELGDGSSDQAFNALVGKLDSNGDSQWLRQFGVDDQFDYATGIDVFGDQVFVTGYSEGYLGINGAESAGGAGDAWIAQLKAKDGKLTEFVGNSAETIIVESDVAAPIVDVTESWLVNDELPVPDDGDNRILPGKDSSTGLTTLDYGDIGLSLGSAFDANSQNSVQSALIDAIQNDPSIFGSDVPDLKLEGSDDVDDILMGLMGDDELKGKKGNDTLYGLAGNDKLEGEDGDDTLYGGEGADELKGGNGNDRFIIETATEAEFDVFNGEGEELARDPQGDTIVNDSGGDVIFAKFDDAWNIETFDGGGYAILGNADNNSFDFKETTLVNVSYVDGGAGEDEIKGGISDETFRGGDDKDKIEGKEGNDSLFGDAGTDDLKGGKGDDNLDGGDDADKLNGEEGNDTLIGGADNDELDGNKGEDILIGVNPGMPLAGLGEFDKLKGGDQADTFVLGDSSQAYYDDNDSTTQGFSDYALIDDFKLDQFDKIQLHGSASSYSLGIDLPNLSKGTAIFLGANQDELIGIVKDVKDLTLTNTNVFTFA